MPLLVAAVFVLSSYGGKVDLSDSSRHEFGSALGGCINDGFGRSQSRLLPFIHLCVCRRRVASGAAIALWALDGIYTYCRGVLDCYRELEA